MDSKAQLKRPQHLTHYNQTSRFSEILRAFLDLIQFYSASGVEQCFPDEILPHWPHTLYHLWFDHYALSGKEKLQHNVNSISLYLLLQGYAFAFLKTTASLDNLSSAHSCGTVMSPGFWFSKV